MAGLLQGAALLASCLGADMSGTKVSTPAKGRPDAPHSEG